MFELTWLRDPAPIGLGIPTAALSPNSALVQQGAQADLMQDSLAAEGFAEHPDPKAEHGGGAVQEFPPLQLFLVDLGGSPGFVPGELAGLVGAGGVGGGLAGGYGWLEAGRLVPRPSRPEPAASLAGSAWSPAPWRF